MARAVEALGRVVDACRAALATEAAARAAACEEAARTVDARAQAARAVQVMARAVEALGRVVDACMRGACGQAVTDRKARCRSCCVRLAGASHRAKPLSASTALLPCSTAVAKAALSVHLSTRQRAERDRAACQLRACACSVHERRVWPSGERSQGQTQVCCVRLVGVA